MSTGKQCMHLCVLANPITHDKRVQEVRGGEVGKEEREGGEERERGERREADLMRAVSLERHCSGVELSSGGSDMSSEIPPNS